MTQEEFDELEADILARIREIKERQRGGESAVHLPEGHEGHRHRSDLRRRRALKPVVDGRQSIVDAGLALRRRQGRRRQDHLRRGVLRCDPPLDAPHAPRHDRSRLVARRPSSAPASDPIPHRCAGRGACRPPISTPSSAFERWLAPRRALLAAIALRGTYLDEEDVARLLQAVAAGHRRESSACSRSRRWHRRGDYRPGRRRHRADRAHAAAAGRAGAARARRAACSTRCSRITARSSARCAARIGADAADRADRGAGATRARRSPRCCAIRRDAGDLGHAAEPMALEETVGCGAGARSRGTSATHADRQSARPGNHRVLRMVPRAPPVRDQRAGAARPPVPAIEQLGLPEFPREPRGPAALARVAAAMKPLRPARSAPAIRRRVTVRLSEGKAAPPSALLPASDGSSSAARAASGRPPAPPLRARSGQGRSGTARVAHLDGSGAFAGRRVRRGLDAPSRSRRRAAESARPRNRRGRRDSRNSGSATRVRRRRVRAGWWRAGRDRRRCSRS